MDLTSPVTAIPKVGPSYAAKLENLNVFTVADLLNHAPTRYLDFRTFTSISHARVGEIVSVKATVKSVFLQFSKSGRRMTIASLSDESGEMMAVWFNQPYLVQILKKGKEVILSGKVDFFGKKKAFITPEYEMGESFIHTGRLVPIYPQTKGLTSKWLRSKIKLLWDTFEYDIEDLFDNNELAKYHLIGLKDAYKFVHFPDDLASAEQGKFRLGFNELFLLHAKALLRKSDWQDIKPTFTLKLDDKTKHKFIDTLPFKLTTSQERSINEILIDITQEIPMNRLLEGDVGSGKTAVAAAACYASFINGFQSVVMAPTQILANQHFTTLTTIFEPFNIRVALVTAEKKDKHFGKADVLVGTHALLHKNVDLTDIALVVIDEQHRFGVEQRAHLTKLKNKQRFAPHSLTMTATPIPRTVALTAYGDLSLSTLDTLPSGRKPITTWVLGERKRSGAYDWIKQRIVNDQAQAYIVCPFVDESDKEGFEEVKSAKEEFINIKQEFKGFKVGLLHGKMKAKEKDDVLDKFKAKKFDILVATPVIEVGIDVPNANVMIVENAERFGLAQLHQLRGRIGRGEAKSYCLLFSKSSSINVKERLNALKTTKSGFELAELDLQLRGPGEIFGLRQHGYLELKNADWNDTDLLKQTKQLAEKVVKNINNYPQVKQLLRVDEVVMN